VTDNHKEKIMANIYDKYQDKLYENNAMDFDDLLVNVCILFSTNPDILVYYQHKFKYILVDEYQDTNGVQYELVKQLANAHHNLCVVGDDDQSIYGWRGADIRNILDFERDFENTVVIKLEQNYRSTKNILTAANKVVAHNKGRKPKALWTSNDIGDNIKVMQVKNEYRESEAIVDIIRRNNYEYKDCAILYRTNAQSRVIEEKMIHNDIPYRLLGGLRFYERKEIKDLIAYLRAISNSQDNVAIKRIINVPKRGIGQATIEKLDNYAVNMNLFDTINYCRQMDILGGAISSKIAKFLDLIIALRDIAKYNDVKLLLEKVLELTQYISYVKITEPDDAEDRIENIQELISKAANYMNTAPEPSLDNFLEEIALVADIDNYDQQSNSVVLMTLHSAKGLEFPVVFMPGLEEGLFPSYMSTVDNGDNDKLEEERRLAYVGITRAREHLYILYANERTLYGQVRANLRSRFLDELPSEVIDFEDATHSAASSFNKKANSFSSNSFTKPSNSKSTFSANSFNAKSSSNKSSFSATTKTAGFSQTNASSFSSAINSNNKPKSSNPPINFSVGDTVKHKLFGLGKVTEVIISTDDLLLTVAFESGQLKKLSTKYAKLQKIVSPSA
ncbi:MAG: ATP-dependent DNA helicase PcrA, partial [Epulopiscium sp. Nele67-Bin001]